MKPNHKTPLEAEQNTERKILAAAEELFLEKGYALTSTVEIAKRAGCNQALVHYYFRTKENLFESIFAQKVVQFMSSVTSQYEPDLPFEEALSRIVGAHFDMIASEPRLPFLIMNELTTNPARIESLRARMMSALDMKPIMRLQAMLDAEIRAGRVRPLTMMDISMSMAFLNVMTFIARPILCGIMQMSDDDYQELIEHRRKENVAVILRSIRP